jgi:hypothetical protein
MGTNKVALRSVEEFMADYVPVYQPIYPLFLGRSQSYSEEVGQLTFKRLEAVGDIRAKHVTPKDTVIKQIGAIENSRSFKKYFLANEFVQSSLQDRQGIEDVQAQVLDEHQKQMDDLFLLGEGTSASTMINNGLFWSNDPNYVLQSSSELASTGGHLPALHASVVTQAILANKVAGRKVIMFYGTTMMPKVNGLYSDGTVPFKRALAEVLGPNFQIAEIPADVTPSSANGFIIANLDQVKMHYTAVPQVHAQGVDDRKMEVWTRFMMGSVMLEVNALNGIIRQPHTFA